jgi:hypothetical protein
MLWVVNTIICRNLPHHKEDEDGSDPPASGDNYDNNFTPSFGMNEDDDAPCPVEQNDAISTTRIINDFKNYPVLP